VGLAGFAGANKLFLLVKHQVKTFID